VLNPSSSEEVKKEIRNKVAEIAKTLGRNAHALKDTDVIPETGLLDSAGIMELIMWYEGKWDLSIAQEDLTLENFGTVESMAAYLRRGGK